MDALSRYGPFQRQSQDEIEKLIRGMNSEILKLSQIDQMEIAITDMAHDRRDEGLTHLVPDSAKEPYDMHEVIRRTVDDGDFFEVFPFWAMNIVTGFARLDGHRRHRIAQGPRRHADIDSSRRPRDSSRPSTSRSSPLGCPGFLLARQEFTIIRHGQAVVRVRRAGAADDGDPARRTAARTW
jgi:hypothetical protein